MALRRRGLTMLGLREFLRSSCSSLDPSQWKRIDAICILPGLRRIKVSAMISPYHFDMA